MCAHRLTRNSSIKTFSKVIGLAVGAAALVLAATASVSKAQSASIQFVPGIQESSDVGIDVPTNYVFRNITRTVQYDGGQYCLSSASDRCSPLAIDDAIRVYVNGNLVLDHVSMTNDFGPVDFGGFLVRGTNEVRVELIDLYGPERGGSAVWLIEGNSPEFPPGSIDLCDAKVGVEWSLTPPLRSPYDIYTYFYKAANEFQAEVHGDRCGDALVTADFDATSFKLNAPNGTLEFTETGDINTSFERTEDGIDSKVDFSIAPTTDGQPSELGIFGGLRYKSTFDNAPYFTVATKMAIGRVAVLNWPSIDARVAQALAAVGVLAVAIMLAKPLVAAAGALSTALVPAVVAGSILLLLQVTGVSLELPSVPRISAQAQTTQLDALGEVEAVEMLVDSDTVGVNEEIAASMGLHYGPLAEFASLGSLVPSRDIVSAYTEFTFVSSGFTPGGEAVVTMGLPGHPESLIKVVEADAAGMIEAGFEMPPAEEVPLGTYLLTAVDSQASLESLALMAQEGIVAPVLTHIAGAHIEVVEDVTPPETVSSVFCSLDEFNICRGPARITLAATDDLSGVGQTMYSLNNGATWTEYTEPFVIDGNGVQEIWFRSVDKVGNEEQAKKSGPVTVQSFTLLTDNILSLEAATDYQISDISRAGGHLRIVDGTTIYIESLEYAGTSELLRNVSTTVGHWIISEEAVPVPRYSLEQYRDLCAIIDGPFTFYDMFTEFDACYYVKGSVDIKTVGASGRLTIIAEGKIRDYSTSSNLEAWDQRNGLLFYGLDGYENMSTGAILRGVIISNTIDGPFTNLQLDGAMFAFENLGLNRGRGLVASQAAGFAPTEHELPLPVTEPSDGEATPTLLPTSTVVPTAEPTATPAAPSPTATATPSPTATATLLPTQAPTETPLPDLVVTTVSLSDENPLPDRYFSLRTCVQNVGAETAGMTRLGFYYDEATQPDYFRPADDYSLVGSVLSGREYCVTSWLRFSDAGIHTVHVLADYLQEESESNEFNNAFGPIEIPVGQVQSTPAATSTPALVPTGTPEATAQPTDTPAPTATVIPAAGDELRFLYVSFSSGGEVPGVDYEDEDILRYDLQSGEWSMFLDMSDFISSGDVNGVSVNQDGTVDLTFDGSVTLPDIGTVRYEDVVRFTPDSPGDHSSGWFELIVDGSERQLRYEDIDALAALDGGGFALSLSGSFDTDTVSGKDEDVIFSGGGDWSMLFDGSDVGVTDDVVGLWVDNHTGEIYMVIDDTFQLGGLSGDEMDIIVCDPTSIGEDTVCTFSYFWDGSAHGTEDDIDGISLSAN